MKIEIYNLSKTKVGDLDLNDEIFNTKFLPDLIHQYIRYQNSKSRQGSHKVKSRSEVNGKSKKPFSQKGTGSARQGSSKPPNFRGGATSMGPVVRDHSFKLNKKEKKLALKSALSSKLNENKIIILENYKLSTHKTKDLVKNLEKFKFDSALFVHSDQNIDKNFKLASSNIPKVSLISDKGINVKDIFTFDSIFIEKNSINQITKRLSWRMLFH